jgi:hypothetical protein
MTPRNKAARGRQVTRKRPADITRQVDGPGSRNPCVSASLRLCVDSPAFSVIFGHSAEAVTNPGRRNRPETKASHLAQPATQSI